MNKIIILGKPNVGKSSLFNCFFKERIAITSDISGTTRDINIKPITINNVEALLCDTAGIVEKEEGIFIDIKQKVLSFVSDDDIVLYVIDGGEIIDDYNVSLFRKLKNATLVVNKIDKKKDGLNDWEYGIFGAKNIFFTSTMHNKGLHSLREFVSQQLNNSINQTQDLVENFSDTIQDSNEIINIGIIGRVNVGKSSILNALLNKDFIPAKNEACTAKITYISDNDNMK